MPAQRGLGEEDGVKDDGGQHKRGYGLLLGLSVLRLLGVADVVGGNVWGCEVKLDDEECSCEADGKVLTEDDEGDHRFCCEAVLVTFCECQST